MNHCTICGVYYRSKHKCDRPPWEFSMSPDNESLPPQKGADVDMVNSPPHYRAGGVECIDAIRAALGHEGFIAYCRGNVIKYQFRADHKNGREDLKKASWYARMAFGDDPRAV